MGISKVLLLILMLFSVRVSARVKIKIAVLAPKESTWGESLKKFAKVVKKESKGEVVFKIFYGGVAGDEPDVLRKIRIGQLQGAVFTGRALGDISGDIRAMEIPFTFFNNRKKAWDTLKKNEKFFNEKFIASGFVNLAFFEIGLVYVVSTKKAQSFLDLKGLKIWSWEGDKLVSTLIETMGFVSVPLSLPDVLSSLNTGLINAAYSSPLGILALQWDTKIKYLIDFPVSFSVGAFLISNGVWKKLTPPLQTQVQLLATKYIDLANEGTVVENQTALTKLKELGVKFLPFPKKDIAEGRVVRGKIISKLQGKLFSKKAVDLVQAGR